MEKVNSLGNRFVALFLSIVIVLGLFPTPNTAADASNSASATTYTVTYNSNGGTQVATDTEIAENLLTKPQNPTREDYVFQGWYKDSACTDDWDFANDKISGNMTLYAKWVGWSSWSSELPSGVNDENSRIESKVQYSYRDKSTTTSDESSLSGWTQYDAQITDWTAWSDWQDSEISSSSTRKVETQEIAATYKTVWHYDRSWGVGSDNQIYSSYDTSFWPNYEAITVESQLPQYGYVSGRMGYTGPSSNGINVWWNEWSEQVVDTPAYTQYRYSDAVYTYYYYQWSAWSDWSDTPVSESSTREVQTRTLYRYLANDPAQIAYGTVTAGTDGGVVSGSGMSQTVTYQEATLDWMSADAAAGRSQDGWWLSVGVSMPSGAENAKVQYKTPSGWVSQNYTSGSDITLWAQLNEEEVKTFLANNTDLAFVWRIAWGDDGVYVQEVTAKVAPSGVVLQKDGTQEHPDKPYGTIGNVDNNGVITGGGEDTLITYSQLELEWRTADAAQGITNDGWWIGVQLYLPEGKHPSDINGIKYEKSAPQGVETLQLDETMADGGSIQLWAEITRQDLDMAKAAGQNLEYAWQFDWNDDGTYEQLVTMQVDPENVLLRKSGLQVYPMIGTVSTYTGGQIIGNGTELVEVLIEETTLQWVPASNLRTEGWWVGIDVVAPENYSADATYKVKTNPTAEYGEEKSFVANKDGENDIQLWFAVSPESLIKFASEDRNLTMTYAFDWDADTVYDQTIVFSVNPKGNIVLKKDAVQIYPELGNVSTYTDGTVTGNKTDDVSVVIEETTLQWSPADPSIGRNQDGWWVGIKVEAPSGVDAATLQNAKYQSKGNPNINWDEITEVKSFWSNKDSNDSAESQYIELWFPLTPASLEKFKAENRNITMVYRFDWEGDGEYDQTVTFSVVPSEKIVLTKVEQTGFAFAEPNPVDKWVGESYTNTANGGQSTGAVTYAITAGADVADIDAATGKLTFKKVGTVTVTATKAADDTYAEVTATYTVKSIKYPQTEFKFANSNAVIAVGFADGSFTNVADGGSGEGAVTYSIIAGNEYATIDENTGEITIVKAGSVTVVAKKAADANYTETTATYTLVIEKSEQEDLVFASSVPTTITYKVDAQSVFTVSGGSGNGGVTYSIIDGNEYATITSETGAITTQKAGGSFTVQVNKAGDHGYVAAEPITTTIYIEHAEQKDFDFATKIPADVTYNDNGNKFTNAASGGLGTGTITYAFKDAASDAIADIDATTGELTILASGTITVVATKAGDDCYNPITAEYTLKVDKDTPEFAVGDVQLVYGATEHQINVNTILGGSGKYVYSIEGTNNIGADVDENGKVTFENSTGKVGTITIKVKKEADTQYVEAEKTFTLTVSYHQPTAQPTVTGDTKNQSGWYTGEVSIHAPEGYEISYANELIGTIWSEEVTVNTDGDNAKKVYLKKGNEISDAISFESIKIDTAAPVNVDIQYDTSFLETVLKTITFGIYQADEVTVTLTATDLTSGVDYFTYNIGGEDIVVSSADFTKNENGVAEYKFTIPAQFRNKVTMKATDVAGWTSELTETEHTLVVDTISPELDVKYAFAGSQNTGETIYSNNDVTVKFEIKESNFDLRVNDPVFKVGSMTVALTWTYDEEAKVWKAEQLLSGDNTYDLSLSYSDESGNPMTKYEQKIIIDSAAPVISSSYGTVIPVKDNIFNTSRTATFTITESNFNAQDVVLTVIAKDITGADVDISAKDYAAYAQNPDNWTPNGKNVYTITLPAFDIDAVYTVDIAYTDLAKNEAADYTEDEFIIDKTPAKVIAIDYSTPVWQKVLSGVTFGAYEKNVVVTVTTEDHTSGVDYVDITYTRAEGASNVNSELIKAKNLDAVQQDDRKTFVTTYTLPADARGTILADVYDNAAFTTTEDDKLNNVVVVDDKDPARTVSYNPYKVLDAETLLEVADYSEGDNAVLYYNGDAVITFAIDEANFDLSLSEDIKKPVITVNGTPITVDWSQNGDEWTAEHTITDDGVYYVGMTYSDVSGNKMLEYNSCKIIIDTTDPVITPAEFTDGDATQEIDGVKYYKTSQTVNIAITDDNFRADDVVLNVTAFDVSGNIVDISSKNYSEYAKTRTNWSSNGNVHTLTLPVFDIDAKYTLDVKYDDITDNVAAEYIPNVFVVDHAAPIGTTTVEYKTPVMVEKVLSAITFGYYKPSVTVVVTASDITSGVDHFNWIYNREENVSSDKNVATESGVITTDKLTYSENGKVATGEFTLTADEAKQYRGNITVTSTDKAGNTSAEYKDVEYISVVDTIDPTRTIAFSDARVLDRATMTDVDIYVEGDDVILYYENEAEVAITVNEANFYAEDVVVTLTKNGIDSTPEVVWTDESADKHIGKFTISGDGDYFVKVTYTDRSGNEMVVYNSQEIRIDNTDPTTSVEYSSEAEAVNVKYYKADRKAVITIVDHNFLADDVAAVVTAVDVQGNKIANADAICDEFATYLKTRSSWSHNGDVHTAEITFDDDAQYTFKIDYKDIIGNRAATYVADPFVVDHTNATNIEITYSAEVKFWQKILNTITFGYYSYEDEITVTLTADDLTSGVDFFEWSYAQEDGTSSVNKVTMDEMTKIVPESDDYSGKGKTASVSFVIPAQARGYISVDVTDKAGNTSGESDDTRINVVDTIAPTRVVSYQPERVLDAVTLQDVSSFVEGDNVILYYEKEAVVTFTINEANFYAEDVVIKVNGVEKAPTDWTQNGDVWTGTIAISGDGDYVVTMTYTDRSTNKMVDYQSQKIAIDNTDPTIAAEYTSAAEAVNVKYYKADRKAVITIVDHNFIADDVVAVVTAVDVQGNKIENADAICAEFATYLKTRSSWSHNGDVHTAEITFDDDAQYTFKIDYKDIIGNRAATYVADPFVVDHTDLTNLKIEYSESVVEKIIETITFGFYKPEVIVTLTADDITSGVDYFDWTYTKEDGTSDKNAESDGARITEEDIVYSNNGLTATATFKIPANARGYVSATVTDRAGNNDSKADDKRIDVVDNIAPTISVKYEADNADTLVQFTDKDLVTVDSFEKAAIAYYNGNVTAKIVINEANFFEGVEAQDGVIYNVGIKLTKTDDNGNETVYEYLPAGAVQKYADATPQYITWTTSGDEHSFNIHYTDNADYVLEIDYTDLSSNDASISANDGNTATKSYKSKVVTVDKIAPAVSVKYGNEKIIHTIDGRDYFDAEQTATITVEEHNFRADDFAASVIAKNILGDNVNVEDFKATLSDDSKWTKNGNTYTITIKYSVDANYTFDYAYKDLAQNAAAEYAEDLFTVDTTAPENLTVTYSTSVLNKVLESITFGYYNAEMTVTITAEDDTAGIYYFVYSYIKSEGVSDVNKELINDKIEDANSRIVHEGKKSTTSFTIPKLLLANDNQFNGTVKFTAFDRSENNTEKVDNQRIVVDNIAPTATITYNQPVQNASNISYYAGNIDAKIVINEANFYSEDVVVMVTKDGTNYPVNVKWVDDSVDVHTGTFTLTADGDYIVTVEYKDRSNNQMAKYTSNRLTLDTQAPSVSVSNIKNNSANKDEKYGFTITATDINLDASSVKPVLTATVRKDDGSYETKTVSLGDMKTVEAGKTYTFTVDNLEEDAVYSLVCALKDMSGNQYSKIVLSDNESYDEVRFSINRNGSTFAVDKDTDTLVNQYYVYSVDEDVVIEEVNVDPVETYVVKLNGEKLTEGTDYTTTLSNKDGEWSKRTYIISKELFESEGEYSIVVESTDKAETTAYSDVKNLNVSFVVDQTAPVLTISGLENGGRYQVEEQTVTIIPTDDGGRLYSIKVVALNSDGEPIKDANGTDISVRFEMSGEEFLTYLTENGGKVTFTVPEGLENRVQIICNDYAVNAEGNTNEFNETFTKVTVSQSQWIIFYANKPLFYGTIAGVVLLVGAIFFLIFFKKRKKEQEK